MTPERYKNAKWDDVPQDIKALLKAISETNRGIYIHGEVGTGKTHIAYAIKARYDELNDRKMVIHNVPEILHSIRSDFDKPYGEKSRIMEDIIGSGRTMVFDDIGAEKITDWVSEQFYLIVNDRYTRMIPTIFTSNLPINDLAERIGDRTTSRIVEMCDIVELIGKDRRITSKPSIKIKL